LINLGAASLQVNADQNTTNATIQINGGAIEGFLRSDDASGGNNGVVFRTLGSGVSIQLLGNSFLGQNAFTDGPNGTDNGRTQELFTGVGPDGNSSSELTASARGAILEVRGNISGTGGLTKQSTDTVILSGTNSYAGATNIANGTLRLGSGTALPTGTNVTTSARGVLDLAGFNASIGNLTSPTFSTTSAFASNGGFITNSSTVTGTLTVNPVAATASYGGTIQNNIALAKAGANRLTLTGNNTYIGATTVNGGTLEVTGTLTATPTVTLNAGGTLLLNSTANNLVNTLANVNLAGGTLSIDNSRTGNTQTFANLNVSAASSINFGTGSTNLFRFNALTGLTAPLAVRSWSGSVYALGTTDDSGSATQDRIRFTANPGGAPGTAINGFVFYNDSGVSIGRGMVVNDSGSTFGVVPTNIATAYWKGDLGTKAWNLGNWSSDLAGTTVTGLAPTGSTDVILSATGQSGQDAMVLGEDMQVKSVTVNNENTGSPVVVQGTGGYILSIVDANAITTAAGSSAATLNSRVNFEAASATITVNSANPLTVNGETSGQALTKAGTGTLVLGGTNTYTGATTISAGILSAASAGALGSSTAGTIVSNDASLELQGGITITGEALTLNGDGATIGADTSGGALRNLSGNNSFTGLITLGSASSIQSDAGTLNLSGGISGTNLNLTVEGSGNTTISGVIATGSGTLIKNNGGTLELTAANTYTGATNINAGTVSISNANGLGTTDGATTVANGAALNINGVSSAENVSISGSGIGSTGALTGTGNAALTGGIALTTSSTIATTTPVSIFTLSGAISGASSNLAIAGPGTVQLSGTNTYGGTTDINEGTLQLGASGTDRIPNGSATTVASNATLDVNGQTETIGSLAGAGNVTLGAGALTTGGNNATTTYSGTLSGTGTLTKQGSGTMTLSGTNTYTGATTVNAGTLAISSEANLGADPAAANAGQLTLNGGTLRTTASFSIDDANRDITVGSSGGTFETATATTLTVASTNAITLDGTLTKSGAGDLFINSSTTGNGNINVTAGTFGGTGTLTASGATTTIGNATLTAATNGTQGTLAFGGNLTTNSNSTWLVDLSGGGSPTSDRINVAGALSLNDALLAINDSTFTFGNRFTIAQYGSLSGTFTWNSVSLTQGASFSTSLGYYAINYQDDGFGGFGGNQITLTAVPEPSQVIAIILLLALGLWFGRRRLRPVKPQEIEG
jgi:autotransporter-associated beta strand protein